MRKSKTRPPSTPECRKARPDPHRLRPPSTPQNWLPEGFRFPHLGQASGIGFPQPLQNWAPLGFSDWQDGHFMACLQPWSDFISSLKGAEKGRDFFGETAATQGTLFLHGRRKSPFSLYFRAGTHCQDLAGEGFSQHARG